jgi:hypothetical protein
MAIPIFCFVRGTRIATPKGEVAIESLRIGDPVTVSGGRSAPVKFVGRRLVQEAQARMRRNSRPILIRQGALEENVPHRDLEVSPMHGIYLEGAFVCAVDLVNGTTIVQRDAIPDGGVEYFHVDLGFHDLLLAEGAAAESFQGRHREVPGYFDNMEEYWSLYGRAKAPAYEPFAPVVPPARSGSSTLIDLGAPVRALLPEGVRRAGRPLARAAYAGADAVAGVLSSARGRILEGLGRSGPREKARSGISRRAGTPGPAK